MYEVIHHDPTIDEHAKYTYADIYVKDRAEAASVSTSLRVQGSKMYIVETAELYVLNQDEGV